MLDADKKNIMRYANIWFNKPDIKAASEKILLHLIEQPIHNLQHLSFSSFRRVTNDSLEDEVLLSVVVIIASQSGLLDIKHELVDDDDVYDVESEEIIEAEHSGFIAHPVTGEEIYDYMTRVFMYFECSEKLSLLKKSMDASRDMENHHG